jgi:phytanoyl-CoA hydroxylase
MNAPLASPVHVAITAQQIRSFVDDGFLVVPNLVSPQDIERLKADTAALARGKYPCKSLEPMPADSTDQQVLERLLCIHQPHFISPVIREFVFHAGIVGVLAKIIGAHLAHWNGAVKCMQSMLFIKPPGKQGQAWHQDEIYIPTRDRSLCGAWIALDDATDANGCLRVVPGSHRPGYLYPQKPHEDTGEFDFAPESHGFDASKEVLVKARAGSVVFFNGYLLHRSKRNRSEVYRRALVSHYMSMNSLLPWGDGTINGENVSMARADSRAVMPVCGEDPYAWKGYQPFGDNVWLRTSAPIEKRAENS